MKRVDRSLDDIRGRIEVGFADLQVNDLFALLFERAGAVQDFKCRFGAKPRHPAGKTQFVLSLGWHGSGWHYSASIRSELRGQIAVVKISS